MPGLNKMGDPFYLNWPILPNHKEVFMEQSCWWVERMLIWVVSLIAVSWDSIIQKSWDNMVYCSRDKVIDKSWENLNNVIER